MTRHLLSAFLLGLVAATLALGVWWFGFRPPTPAAKSSPPPVPATMTKVLKEDQINTVTLTAAAIDRLALKTSPVEKKAMPRSRVYGGEAMIPVGQGIIVSAPVGGMLRASGAMPKPGETVKKGQVIYRLSAVVPPEARATLTASLIDAEGQVETTKSQLDGARIALERSRRLLQREAGSRRAVDEAQAIFDVAQKATDAARDRAATLKKVTSGLEKGSVTPIDIEVPESGMVRNLTALSGQSVAAGGALFEIVNLDRIWIRVPIYVGDLRELDSEADAGVTDLNAPLHEPTLLARRAVAPPSANAAAGTVDRFYEMNNKETKYSPGQRVGVRLPLSGEVESLTVPASAILIDIYGGTWVYEQTAELNFTRRRVTVRFVSGTTAVLATGPPVGMKVVTAGAAELFGTETGFSK